MGGDVAQQLSSTSGRAVLASAHAPVSICSHATRQSEALEGGKLAAGRRDDNQVREQRGEVASARALTSGAQCVCLWPRGYLELDCSCCRCCCRCCCCCCGRRARDNTLEDWALAASRSTRTGAHKLPAALSCCLFNAETALSQWRHPTTSRTKTTMSPSSTCCSSAQLSCARRRRCHFGLIAELANRLGCGRAGARAHVSLKCCLLPGRGRLACAMVMQFPYRAGSARPNDELLVGAAVAISDGQLALRTRSLDTQTGGPIDMKRSLQLQSAEADLP